MRLMMERQDRPVGGSSSSSSSNGSRKVEVEVDGDLFQPGSARTQKLGLR